MRFLAIIVLLKNDHPIIIYMFNHFQRYKNIPSDKKNPPPNGRFPAFHDNRCNNMFF